VQRDRGKIFQMEKLAYFQSPVNLKESNWKKSRCHL
jgi:hypothetical protein